MNLFNKVKPLSADVLSFVREAFSAARSKIYNIVMGFYHHTEAIAILLLASLGLNSLIGELPFYMMLPLWIEASMVIPVISVVAVGFLVSSSSWRAKRRMARVG